MMKVFISRFMLNHQENMYFVWC